MKTALLDANVLIALLWPAHEHHDAALAWFGAAARRRWATCPLTQLAFARIVSNPAFSPDALSPAEALVLLARNLRHPRHAFWPDDLPLDAGLAGAIDRLQATGRSWMPTCWRWPPGTAVSWPPSTPASARLAGWTEKRSWR